MVLFEPLLKSINQPMPLCCTQTRKPRSFLWPGRRSQSDLRSDLRCLLPAEALAVSSARSILPRPPCGRAPHLCREGPVSSSSPVLSLALSVLVHFSVFLFEIDILPLTVSTVRAGARPAWPLLFPQRPHTVAAQPVLAQ